MATGSKKVIFAAMAGNGLIAVTKFAAAAWTGSSAMLSEGIHSVVDTGNQVLLLHGMRRARRPADERHPFGYGAEVYFWAFVVAILIFAVGAGISIYEGIIKILEPHPITDVYINFIVLGLAVIFEGVAWTVAYRAFQTARGRRGIFEAVRASKDPTVFTVLFEDTAAMLGLVVAFVGIGLAAWLGAPWLDGAASIMIGLILAATAVLLAIETKSLLIGEAAEPEITDAVCAIVQGEPGVTAVNEVRTLHRGPTDILLAVSVDFQDDLRAGAVEEAVYRIEKHVKQRFPSVRRLFVEIQSARHHREMLPQSETELGS